jgi:Tfp pilus assembly protein PilO
MAEHVYLLTILLPLWTILLVFGMKYFSSYQQARARMAEDQAYRQMTEKAAAAQSQTAAALVAIQDGLAELRTRLASVEKILKDVG